MTVTAYQVYQNISEQDAVNQAVDETKGLVMTSNDDLIESFYYSTSWGFSSGYDTWREGESKDYLVVKELSIADQPGNIKDSKQLYNTIDFQNKTDHISQNYVEKEEPWFRWNYEKYRCAELFTESLESVRERFK